MAVADRAGPGLYMVELRVRDWSRSVAWYANVLGLRVLLRVPKDQFAQLQAGDGRIALLGRPGTSFTPGTGVTLTLHVDDLPAAVRSLHDRGAVLDSEIQTSPEGYRRVLLHDPDGYHLCLFDWGPI